MPIKNPIDCLTAGGIKDVEGRFKKLTDSGKSDIEAAREIIVQEHRELFNQMEGLKGNKNPKYIEPPYPDEKIKYINENYDEKIKEIEDEKANQPPPPPETPIEETGGGKIEGGTEKGILNRLYNAKNVPEAAKKGFEEKGLKYEPQSWEESDALAKAVVDEFGVDEAVNMAEGGRLKGGVRSAVFAESLTRLKLEEDAATNDADKFEIAKRFAEIAIRYDEFAREQGRDISQIGHFYQKSPLGIVLYENKKRGEDFNNWSKPKEKSWKEFFEDLMKEPEFKKEVDEKIQEQLKKERQSSRAKRMDKVRDTFAKAKKKFSREGGNYATIIPPHIMETAIEAMELLYEAGEAVAYVVQKGIDKITELKGDSNWDKDKFRKEWEEKLADGKKEPTPEDKAARVIEKFRKKLNGLSDKQKADVITRAHKQLINNGALEFEDFRKIIGDVTGRGELSQADAKRMMELVQETNKVEDAAKKLREERTPEAFKNFRETEAKAGKAAKELNDLFYNKPDIIKRLTSIMQLNTLGLVALVNNPIYNIWNQSTLRFPIGVVNDLIDRSISGVAKLAGKQYDKEYNIVAAQKGFWEMLGLGSKEAFSQIFTGLNRQDYMQKEVYGQQIRPASALRDLSKWAAGKKSLSKAQIIDKTLQVYPGAPAEIVARVLNLGDKPMRFGAEGGTASQFAKKLGLKEMDFKLFLEFPREEAYRAYKTQGLSDAEASQKADYIKEAIMQEGERSTFQQDNLLTDVLASAVNTLENKTGLPKDSGVGNLLKILAISPYIKIPSNAFWSFYNLLNPEVAMVQALGHGARAKIISNKGDYIKSKLAQREARYWLAHAVVGIAMRAVVIALVKQGIFSPGTEDDEKKERDAAFTFDKPGTFKVGEYNLSNRWGGSMAMMGNQIAKRYNDMTPEQRENVDDFWNIVYGGMEREGLAELQNGVFGNTSTLLQAAENNNWDRYLTNTLNLFTNIIQPATVAQINRSSLDEVPASKGDNLLDKINQEFSKRSTIYRNLTNTEIYKKRDIWGDTVPKGGNVLSRMFGISKANPQIGARVIYEDAIRTGDAAYLPPAIYPTLNNKKLNTQQYDRLLQYIGGERKKEVLLLTDGGEYKLLSEKEKKEALSKAYSTGRKNGLELFYSDYPDLMPEKKEK